MSKQITKFSKANLPAIRAEIDAALASVLTKYGLAAELGNIKFSDQDFRAQITVNTGSAADGAKRKFDDYAYRFGLTGNEFGKFIASGGKKYKIIGLNPKSRKYPIIATNNAGSQYKFTADMAKTATKS